MQITTLASGSKANCYILEDETEAIIIECGVPFLEVKKHLDFDTDKIKCVLLTHLHQDHAKYLKEYVASGIPIITSNGTIGKLGFSFSGYHSGYWYQFGSFNITPFSVEHDCAEPFGFLIRHDDIGTMLFATDTQYIRYDFSNLRINHLMIECNYSMKLIEERADSGWIHDKLKNRVIKTHMELETCKEFILKNMSSALDNVVLLHLSDGNSDERLFQKEVSEIVGKGTKVFVADNGLTVDLNIRPW